MLDLPLFYLYLSPFFLIIHLNHCYLISVSPSIVGFFFVFVYDPIKEEIKYGVEGRGSVVMAIDNLPAEISRESSIFFSDALKPFIPEIAQADFSGNFESCNLPYAIKKAVILFRGSFTPDYEYMKNFIK